MQTAVSTGNYHWNRIYCSVYTSLMLKQEKLQYLQVTQLVQDRLKFLQVTLTGTGQTAISTGNSHWNRTDCSVYS
jgi:hypothetical protein